MLWDKKRLRLILPFDSRSDLINFLFKAPALQYAADNGKQLLQIYYEALMVLYDKVNVLAF